ncbi:MarR family transcriptional regulator [Terrabacter sp. NPDC000476]|uniref:MarR family winged helix-turn-helix transcriptional regulator n=1 Tax=Terrabacter sp. NPDC000476 TaxID=3154258 RepID=UPI0033311E93
MDEHPLALADDLYDVIGLLRRRSGRLVGSPLPHLALSGAQLELARVVRRNPGITVAEAARVLGLAANTVSTLVGQLVTVGVVVRARDTTDRRVVRLELTASAREGLERWRDRRAASTAAALATLDEVERERLAAALTTIARVAASLTDDDATVTALPRTPADQARA